jgi:hypothetical protein
MTGVRIHTGISDIILAKKYPLTEYMLLFTSLKKTGLSSGKIRIVFWMALKAIVIVIKKRAPFLFWTPWRVPSTFENKIIAKQAVTIVTNTFT